MKLDIVRAWKDDAYRANLSPQEQALLPENPAGALELSDAELEATYGAKIGPNVGGHVSCGCTLGDAPLLMIASCDSIAY
jgi:mersacidin/lichenicidin family type 2 lantibiotic